MSFEKFKNEIKEENVSQLLDRYRLLNVNINKWQTKKGDKASLYALEEESKHRKDSDNKNIKIGGDQVISRYLPKFKKQRAIVLTKLNQLGWNGKGLKE